MPRSAPSAIHAGSSPSSLAANLLIASYGPHDGLVRLEGRPVKQKVRRKIAVGRGDVRAVFAERCRESDFRVDPNQYWAGRRFMLDQMHQAPVQRQARNGE